MSLFFLLIAYSFGYSTPLSCSNTMKQGPYKLHIPSQTLPNITRLTLSIKKTNLTKESAHMVLGYRTRWTSYCYNGGALDPNTGCIDSLTDYPPSKEELTKWDSIGKCEVCLDYHDAWGADSSKCLEKPAACGVWFERKELEKKSTNNRFAYHVCELNWRCGISRSQIPVIVKEDNYAIKTYFALPNGTLTPIVDYYRVDGSTALYISEVPPIMITKFEAKCVEEGNNYWCIDPSNNQAFRVKKDKGSYCLYSTCYSRLITKIEKTNEEDYKIAKASLEDLSNVFVKEMLEIEDLKYTVLRLAHRTILIEDMLMKTITSLAKIDDKLLQRFLGGSFSSEFLTDDQFFLKPCLRDPKTMSNCVGNKIYSEGRWVLNTNKANCINLKSSKEINLFQVLDVWLPEVSEQKYVGTPDEYTGWSFYANSKQSLQETMQYTRNGGSGSSLQDVLNMPHGGLTSILAGLWGFSLTGLIGAGVAMVMLFFVCRKL